MGSEAAAIVKVLLLFAVTALHFAAVPGGVRPNELVPNAKLFSGTFEQSRNIAHGIGEAIASLSQ